jgi:ubiquinone/menaquinone biosynthesis C-methylase UbiE
MLALNEGMLGSSPMDILFDDEVAKRYDGWYLSPAGRYVERVENELLLDLLKPYRAQRLLDVGCGTGNHLLLFRQMGLDVTGIDPSAPMLRVARDKLGSHADLHVGVAEDLPFDDNSFDIVSIITALEFCADPFQALSEAFRVARARIIIGVLNRYSATGVERKVEGLFQPTLFRHARFYSIWGLRRMIRRILGRCEMEWASVIWFPLARHNWDRHLDRWLPRSRNPFGAFLGMRVEIPYTHQAVLNPLSARWLDTADPETQPGALSGSGCARRVFPIAENGRFPGVLTDEGGFALREAARQRGAV